MARSQVENKQGNAANAENVQERKRSFGAYQAWVGRLRHYVTQRERTTSFWTMNPDGHLVRQSWQSAVEQADIDCVPCCM